MNRLAWIAVIAASATVGQLASPRVGFSQTPPPSTPPAVTAPAVAVPAAPAGIPADARTGAAPEAFKPQVTAFIKGHIARIQTLDSKAMAASRDALVAEVTGVGVTSGYKDIYTAAILAELPTLLSSPKPLVRLQGAVLAAKIAAAVDNAQLTPIAVKLLADKSPAMVVYGMKISKAIIAYQIQIPGSLTGSPLPTAVTGIAVANPERGDYTRDAVDALSLDLDKLNKLSAQARTAALKELVPDTLKILAARSKLYTKGLPEDPEADRVALTFFSNIAFASLDVKQRQEVLQRYIDILLLTAQASANTDTVGYRAMAVHMVQVGRGLYIIASALDKTSTPDTKAFLKATEFFRTASDTLPPPSAEMSAKANAAFDAIKKLPEYSKLELPVAAGK